MAQRIFISAAASDDTSALTDALAEAGFEPVGAGSAELGHNWSDVIRSTIASAALVVAILPPADSDWVRTEIDGARQLGKPIILIETSLSRRPDANLREYTTLRSDLEKLTPIILAIRARLGHPALQGASPPVSGPALSQGQVRQWTRAIKGASDDDRLERQVSMMLADAGIELSPPGEIGPDFVGWSEGLANVAGNPFLIEIKRDASRVDDVAERQWLSRAGLRTLFLLLGSENDDVALVSTAEGQTVVQLPVVELVHELGRSSLVDAVRTLLRRTGVDL
jgi:hypothetical protein